MNDTPLNAALALVEFGPANGSAREVAYIRADFLGDLYRALEAADYFACNARTERATYRRDHAPRARRLIEQISKIVLSNVEVGEPKESETPKRCYVCNGDGIVEHPEGGSEACEKCGGFGALTLERENARLLDVLTQARLLLEDERRLGGMRCFANNALQVLFSAVPNETSERCAPDSRPR